MSKATQVKKFANVLSVVLENTSPDSDIYKSTKKTFMELIDFLNTNRRFPIGNERPDIAEFPATKFIYGNVVSDRKAASLVHSLRYELRNCMYSIQNNNTDDENKKFIEYTDSLDLLDKTASDQFTISLSVITECINHTNKPMSLADLVRNPKSLGELSSLLFGIGKIDTSTITNDGNDILSIIRRTKRPQLTAMVGTAIKSPQYFKKCIDLSCSLDEITSSLDSNTLAQFSRYTNVRGETELTLRQLSYFMSSHYWRNTCNRNLSVFGDSTSDYDCYPFIGAEIISRVKAALTKDITDTQSVCKIFNSEGDKNSEIFAKSVLDVVPYIDSSTSYMRAYISGLKYEQQLNIQIVADSIVKTCEIVKEKKTPEEYKNYIEAVIRTCFISIGSGGAGTNGDVNSTFGVFSLDNKFIMYPVNFDKASKIAGNKLLNSLNTKAITIDSVNKTLVLNSDILDRQDVLLMNIFPGYNREALLKDVSIIGEFNTEFALEVAEYIGTKLSDVFDNDVYIVKSISNSLVKAVMS